ncbi:MAG: hypothetical protein M3N29_05205 [Chloroflexota bacterium]|nr:hypothetical protein [Chloroflexota bacterium]
MTRDRDDDCPPLLQPRLPAGFDRWRLSLPAGAERATSAQEWAGALVMVEQGTIEVSCVAGGRCRFVAGDVLALGWLPLKALRNPGPGVMQLVAIRRRGDRPTTVFLHLHRPRRVRSPR